MDNYTLNQAQQQLEQIQNYQQQIAGQPVRVYPFKIVSGLNYLSNRGLSDIGTNPGSSFVSTDQTMSNSIPYGAYTDLSLIYSGNKPIICYWFGVINATLNSDGTVSETINASQDENGNWVPNQFANPLTAQARDTSKSDMTQWQNMEVQNPWKEVGVIDFAITPSETRKEQLDNVDVGVYSTVYNFSTFSNTWYPTYQEMNEFVYFIVDSRYACPIALRITSITPHFRPDGVFQYCDIQFQSVNQYFNTTSRSILTYIKFGAPNDAYCFPQEIVENGAIKTIINPNFLLNSQGGVDSVCIKNNSLVAHLGTLIYGHPYTPFQESNGVLTRTNQSDRYLLPLSFEAPINDNIVSKQSLVHSSYSLAMNMVVVSEQLWGSWKQTKEVYNPIQNFTYQGGLAFAGGDNTQNQALYNSINSILNPNNEPILKDQIMKNSSPVASGYTNWGSCNLQAVMYSNRSNYPLDVLQSQVWEPLNTSGVSGTGFYISSTLATWDFRFSKLCSGLLTTDWTEIFNGISGLPNVIWDLADLFSAGYEPSTKATSEIGWLSNLANFSGTFISPTTAFILNSMSVLNTHMLEVNYRDGVVYTNTNRGHGGFLNMIANWFSGIADKIIGYTPGVAQFFMNTAARTYNMFIPSSLLPLFQAYLDPNGSNYEAVPLDIFNNSYDNNTAVGQLQYLSGLQFSLTDTYESMKDNTPYTTTGWRRITTTNYQTVNANGQKYNVPDNSFAFFKQSIPNAQNVSYIIDEINVKELGQSNLHITYLKNVNNKLNNVGEEWVANNAKVMKNNTYIENAFDYYVYDEYNTTFATNVSPYTSLEYSPLPTMINKNLPTFTLKDGTTRDYYSVSTTSIQGITVNSFESSNWNAYVGPKYYVNISATFDESSWQGLILGGGNWVANPTSTTINNQSYMKQCNAATTSATNGYLNAIESASNCYWGYFTQISNELTLTGYVYYDWRQIVFNIKHLLSNIQWEYVANSDYTNIMCLVPVSYTAKEINAINIPSNLPTQKFIGFYDGKTFNAFGYSANIDFMESNYTDVIAYNKSWVSDYWVVGSGEPVIVPRKPDPINTFLNAGGIVKMLSAENPTNDIGNGYGLYWDTLTINDIVYTANPFGETAPPVLTSYKPTNPANQPDTPTKYYVGNSYKLVMIVLK